MAIRSGALCLVFALAIATGSKAAEPPRQLIVGTGSKGGVYYPAGRAICRMLDRHNARKAKKWTCQQRESAGSVANLEGLRESKFDLAVVQSDTHYHAYTSTGKFKEKGAITELRSLFSLHAEPFTVIARAGGGVWKIEQLRGKRVNVGKKGSGPRETFLELLNAMGWNATDFSGFTQISIKDQAAALCDGRTDVTTFVVGHPASMIEQALSSCNTVLVNVAGPAITKLIQNRPYYRRATIPAGLYRGSNSDIRTFGVSATFVTTSKLDADAAYTITQAVFENIGKFRSMHPALKYLNKAEMAKASLSAPLHDGAKKYFEDIGLR